jgi:hypothetical protein
MLQQKDYDENSIDFCDQDFTLDEQQILQQCDV